jgi:hypothetical protein
MAVPDSAAYHLRELASRGEEDDQRLWCAPLTAEQAARALDRNRADAALDFLHALAGCLCDGEGVRRLERKPRM